MRPPQTHIGWAVVLLALTALDCSGEDQALPHFNDIPSAPEPIQRASAAVVRIRTAGETATGSFISSTGLLLTNNHVLGIPVCPAEGCFVELTFMHQRGVPPQEPMPAFALPIAVDAGLDMAVVQIRTTDNSNLSTPSFLSFASTDAGNHLGHPVTILGHPQGRLKKWTTGSIVDVYGDWFTISAYSLPGESGSPVLDDQGRIVGLIHRGPTSEDLVTDVGVNVYSVGTPVGPLIQAMNAELPSTLVSTVAPTTAADVVAHDLVFLNAHVTTATVEGAPVSVLSLLGEACDAALARRDFQSPGDLASALVPCNDGQLWIECRADAQKVPYGPVCPAEADQAAWRSRFAAMNEAWVDLNGNTLLSPVSFGIAALSSSTDQGKSAGAQTLTDALTAAHQALDFGVANFLAAFGVPTYDGREIVHYARTYRSSPGYQFQARSIASTLGWLASNGSLSRDELITLLEQLANDPMVNVGTKLYVEDLLYQGGVIH